MILYPAIDLKGGQAVRLTRGEMGTAQVYNADPAAQAQEFEKSGFFWIHVVDLDGAMDGAARNAETVNDIVAATDLPVQLGGGIRSLGDVERWIGAGVARVIIGTAAVRDPDMLRAACRAFPGKVAVGIDARGGRVALQGWTEQSAVLAQNLARDAQEAGACAIIHTDIDRDGTGAGLNVTATAALAQVVGIPVIASGGVGGPGDITAVRQNGTIAGAIVGKALYNGSLTHAQALEAAGPQA